MSPRAGRSVRSDVFGSAGISLVSHSLQMCVCVCFSNSRANVCKVVSQCGVDFIPLVISGVEHLFLCLSAFV